MPRKRKAPARRRSPSDPEPMAEVAGLARVRVEAGMHGEAPVIEPEHCHAALVLWAMCEVRTRSTRAIARACNRSDSVIRTWSRQWCWAERVAREGHSGPATAARLWAYNYLLPHGAGPAAELSRYVNPAVLAVALGHGAVVDRPLGDPGELASKDDSGLRHATEADASRVELGAGAPDDGSPGTGTPLAVAAGDGGGTAGVRPAAEVRSAEADRLSRLRADRARTLTFYGQTQRLIEASVGALGKQLRDALSHPTDSAREQALGRLGLRLRDLPALVKEHKDLAEILGLTATGGLQATGSALEPSYRVALAERVGTDPALAMIDDVDEVRAILVHLRDRAMVASDAHADSQAGAQDDPAAAPRELHEAGEGERAVATSG
jgi:hypothetical protein